MVKIGDNLTLQKETLNCSEDKNLVIATEVGTQPELVSNVNCKWRECHLKRHQLCERQALEILSKKTQAEKQWMSVKKSTEPHFPCAFPFILPSIYYQLDQKQRNVRTRWTKQKLSALELRFHLKQKLGPRTCSLVITPGEVCSICCIDHMERDW